MRGGLLLAYCTGHHITVWCHSVLVNSIAAEGAGPFEKVCGEGRKNMDACTNNNSHTSRARVRALAT